jgi:hypothetical protein
MKETIKTEVNEVLLNLEVQQQTMSITQAEFNQSKADVELYHDSMLTNIDRRGKCPVIARFNYQGYPTTGTLARTIVDSDTVWDAGIGGGLNLIPVSLNPPAGSSLTYNTMLPGAVISCPDSCVCTKLDNVAEATFTSRYESMQNMLIARLDRTNGRLGAQKSRKLALMKKVIESNVELYDFIIDLSTGLEPLTKPEYAVLDDVIAVYVDGPLAYGIDGQPNIADSVLRRTTILDLDQATDPLAMGKLLERCQVSSLPLIRRPFPLSLCLCWRINRN